MEGTSLRDVIANRSATALLLSRLGASMAAVTLVTALGKQVYDMTGSELALGMLGLAEFLPSFLLVLGARNGAGYTALVRSDASKHLLNAVGTLSDFDRDGSSSFPRFTDCRPFDSAIHPQAREVAGIGGIAQPEVDAVGALVDGGAQGGQAAGGADQFEPLGLGCDGWGRHVAGRERERKRAAR